jgi:putative spermidine/putrescine transport system substrate-binding protein
MGKRQMVLKQRRQFLRRCALLGGAFVNAACTSRPPEQPSFFATPAAAVELPTETPRVTPTRTPQPTVAIPTSVAFPSPPAPGVVSFAESGGLARLQAEALREGTLVLVGIPRDWLKYGQIIDLFKQKYPLNVVELYPEYGSRDTVDYVRSAALDANLISPDVMELGASYGVSMRNNGFLQPYRTEHWDDINPDIKDSDGYWYGTYYGVMSFAVNRGVVANPPSTWADLANQEYIDKVGLTGSPIDSLQALYAVMAATLEVTGGLDDVRPGIELMRRLKDAETLVSLQATNQRLLSGDTTIIPMWSYLALALRDFALGNPAVDVVVPQAALGSPFLHGINAYAQHPAAARLWIEHLYSAEVQQIWLESNAMPARFTALNRLGTFAPKLLERFPALRSMERCTFATVNQVAMASSLVAEQWNSIMGGFVSDT